MFTSPSSGPRHGALVVLFALLALSPALFWAGGVEPFESAKSLLLLLAGILLAWFGLVGWLTSDEKWFPRDPVTLAVLGGLVATGLATLASISPLVSLLGCMESHGGLLTVAALTAGYLAARWCVRSREQAVVLVAGVVIASTMAAAYGLAQALHVDPAAWEGQSGFAGWSRPGGTEGHAIKLGAVLVGALPLVFWLGERGGRTVTALLAVLFLAALGTLLARGAWLGAAAAGCVGFCLVGRPSWLTWPRIGLGLAAAVAVLALTGVLGPLLHRVAGMGASESRLYIFRSAWGLFLERPVLGWGPDTFQFVFGRHRMAEYWALEWGRTPFRAHNEFLHVLATQGALGGIAFVGLMAALVWASWLAWQRAPQQRGLVAALVASVVAHQVQLLTGFSTITSGALFAVVCALLSRLSEGPLEEKAPFPLGRWLVWAAAGAGWLVLAGNLLAYNARPLALVDVAVLLGLAVPPLLAAWAYLPAGELAEEEASWSGSHSMWPGPVALLGLGAAVLVWLVVVRPAVAWGLCQASPEEAVRWCPEREEVWANAGRAATQASLRAMGPERLRQMKRAHEAVEQWCRLCPVSPEAHDQRARALLELARAGEAGLSDVLEAYDAALRLDERNTVFLRDAGRAALAMGDAGRAEPYLKRALEVGPRHGSVLAELAAVAFLRRDRAHALALIQEAEQGRWYDDLEGYHRALGLWALIGLELHEDNGNALHLARVVAPQRPDWPVFPVIEGIALERMGRPDEARAAYRRALGLEPANPHALAGLRRLEVHRAPTVRLTPSTRRLP
jgi:O-antigen ligase/Flp pilus assembly protein TadD